MKVNRSKSFIKFAQLQVSMKLSFQIAIIFLAICMYGSAQEESQPENKSRFRPGIMWYNTGWKPAKPGKVPKYDRLMFDITYNDWIGDRKTFKMKGPSMGMNVNWLFEFPLVKNNLLSIAFGPSYGFYNLRHDMPIVYDEAGKYTQFGDLEDQGYFGKRRLVGHQLAIPVEFRIRTKGFKHFKVHLGGKIGYQLALTEKAKFEQEGEMMKTKIKASDDVNRLVYSAHVRIGIRNFALYGSYNFNPFYGNANSTQLHLLQLGLTVSLF